MKTLLGYIAKVVLSYDLVWDEMGLISSSHLLCKIPDLEINNYEIYLFNCPFGNRSRKVLIDSSIYAQTYGKLTVQSRRLLILSNYNQKADRIKLNDAF